MLGRLQSMGWTLLATLALAPASAMAGNKAAPELKLKLNNASVSAPARPNSRGTRRPARFQQAQPSLSERALQGLLQDADEDAALVDSGNTARFRFKRQGNAGRDLAAGYNAVCETVSQKVWDEPNGKRVRFDINGKPGLAMEIPLR